MPAVTRRRPATPGTTRSPFSTSWTIPTRPRYAPNTAVSIRHPRLRQGESDHRIFPVGFALVLRDTGLGGGDALPCLFPVGAVEPVRRNRNGVAAGQFD